MPVKLFVFLSLIGSLYSSGQSKLTFSVSNFENNKGVCRACLFNSEESFKQNKAIQCITIPVANKAAVVEFTNIAPGTYSMFVFHDANNNNKMDKNFLGIPSEGYGASKNNLPFAAAPTFSGNQFTVTKGFNYSFKVRLRNL
jgi:uncharacterized protein (DUF2141 family)